MKSLALSILIFLSLNNVSAEERSGCAEKCTFVLLSEATGTYTIINKKRAKQRLTPWSTFKIPNSLIFLDSGIVGGVGQQLSFDQEKYPVQDWWPKKWYQGPMTLTEAFKVSAVPIYQELAATVDAEPMEAYLDQFDYGNQNISSGVDQFWLNGSLRISAKEQVIFLQKMYKNEFAVSKDALSLLKNIMLVEDTEQYKLYAKTGAGHLDTGVALGWYVGFIENKSGVHYFAFNIEGAVMADILQARINLAKQYLIEAGAL